VFKQVLFFVMVCLVFGITPNLVLASPQTSIYLVSMPDGSTKSQVIQTLQNSRIRAFHWVEDEPVTFAIPATSQQMDGWKSEWIGCSVEVYSENSKVSRRLSNSISINNDVDITLLFWGDDFDYEAYNLTPVGPANPKMFFGYVSVSVVGELASLPMTFLVTGAVGGIDELPIPEDQVPAPEFIVFEVNSRAWDMSWKESEYGDDVYSADCCQSMYAALWAIDGHNCACYPYGEIWLDYSWHLDDLVYEFYWSESSTNGNCFDGNSGKLIPGSFIDCTNDNEYYIKEISCINSESYRLSMNANPPNITSAYWSASSSSSASQTGSRACGSTIYLHVKGSGFNSCASTIYVNFGDGNVSLSRQSDSWYIGSWTTEWRGSDYRFEACIEDPCSGDEICRVSNWLDVYDNEVDDPADPTSPSNGTNYCCGQNIRLDWNSGDDDNDCSGIDEYRVQIDENSSFSSPSTSSWQSNSYKDFTACSHPISNHDRYYWRVQTKDNAGNESNWSSYRNFDIVEFSITEAEWQSAAGSDIEEVDCGTTVHLKVTGEGFSGCGPEQLTARIYETDAWALGSNVDSTQVRDNLDPPDEFIQLPRQSDSTYLGSWVANWAEDTGGSDDNPEYKFEVDHGGESETSDALKVVDDFVLPTNLLTPHDWKFYNVGDNINLSWSLIGDDSDCSGLISLPYILQISTSPSFNGLVVENHCSGHSASYVSHFAPFEIESTYFWRVKTEDISGNESFSNVHHFVVSGSNVSSLLEQFDIHEIYGENEINIYFNDVGSYDFQLVRDSEQSNIVIQQEAIPADGHVTIVDRLEGITIGESYSYRLSISEDGTNWMMVASETLTYGGALPLKTHITSVSPNPFNPSTLIEFDVSKSSHISLCVYDLEGKVVKTVCDNFMSADHYQFTWNGKCESGSIVSAGIYLLVLESNTTTDFKKITLLK
jgi:hypothetical protein